MSMKARTTKLQGEEDSSREKSWANIKHKGKKGRLENDDYPDYENPKMWIKCSLWKK